MESEDEEIIFENSVLHKVLTDIGVTDLKTEPRLYIQDHFENGPNLLKETNNYKARVLYSLNSNFIARVFYTPKFLEEVHHYHRYHILKWLITSNLLSEDDQLFLQSYVDEEAPKRNPSTCLSLYTFKFVGILIASLVLVGIVCPMDVLSSWVVLLISNMPQAFSGLNLYSKTLSSVLLIITWTLCFLIPVTVLKRNIYHKIVSQIHKQDKLIKDMVIQAEDLLRLEKKSLRLIKESELVARGFTLANQHHVASRGSQALASSSSHQLCPGLRQIMFSENVKVMQEVKKWVVKMLRGIPMICMDSDFSSLETLKLHESQPHKQDETISSITEGTCTDLNGFINVKTAVSDEGAVAMMDEDIIISPSELNRSVELLSIYFSGFIRRLAMCFYPQNLRDTTVNPYAATMECTEMSKKAIERARSLLKQSYTFYRSVHHYDRNGPTKKIQESKQGQSQIQKLYICVNSLDLHLQSLLQITRNLTVTLEDQVDKEQNRVGSEDITKPNEDDRKLWQDTLKRIKSGLESCRGCYEESLKVLHQKVERDTTISPVKKPSPDTPEPKQMKVTWLTAEDPIIVDQVFEAVNDEIEDNDTSESRPKYTTEERARFQEEKEAVTRFRQELQTVVGHRAIVQKAREERALARARGEDTSNQQTCQEQQSDLVPEILSQAMDRLEFLEKEEPKDMTINAKLQSQQTSREAIESGIVHQCAEIEPVLIFSSQTEKEKHKVPCEVGIISLAALGKEGMSRDKWSQEQLNHFVQEQDTSVNFQINANLTSTCHNEEKKLLDHECVTDSNLQSVVMKKQSNILEKQDLECGLINTVGTEPGGFRNGDIVRAENGMMKGNRKILHANSEPCSETSTSYEHFTETIGNISDFGSNLSNSHRNDSGIYLETSCKKEEIHGNSSNVVTLKDSKSESTFLQLTPAVHSDCHELFSLSSYVSNQTTALPTHPYGVNISYENLVTVHGGNAEPQKQGHMDLKFHDRSTQAFPLVSSSNFTKNIALMAASQARNLTSYLDEEHFGDESSDSEQSSSEINDCSDKISTYL